MSSLIVLTVVIVVVVVLLGLLSKRPPGEADDFPYESCQFLFSPAERSFLGVLEQAVGDAYQVFGKVRLNDVIKVQKGLPRSVWQSARNRIDRKHIDFVICKKDDFSIVAVVELDDKSHARKDRVERDRFLDQAFAATEILFLRFPVRKGYVLEEVKSHLAVVFATPSDYDVALHGSSVDVPAENNAEQKVAV